MKKVAKRMKPKEEDKDVTRRRVIKLGLLGGAAATLPPLKLFAKHTGGGGNDGILGEILNRLRGRTVGPTAPGTPPGGGTSGGGGSASGGSGSTGSGSTGSGSTGSGSTGSGSTGSGSTGSGSTGSGSTGSGSTGSGSTGSGSTGSGSTGSGSGGSGSGGSGSGGSGGGGGDGGVSGGGGSGGGGGGGNGGGGGGNDGGAGSGGVITGANQCPQTFCSPPTRPWVVELPRMPIAQPIPESQLIGAPIDPVAGISPEDAIQRSPHQLYSKLLPKKFYELHEKQAPWSFHPDLPTQPIWGFNGSFPGPTFMSRYGEPCLVRIHNDLPKASNLGFGIPSTSTHLHNGHTASESDGFPGDFINSGQFHDHHYPHVLPGFTTDPNGIGDKREALHTLWYHDHRADFTASNTYAGLVGYHLLFDDVDSGDEEDTNPQALRLPSGEYDVPLIFADRVFDSNGILFFDNFNFDGMLGDKWLVNGAIQPFMKVARRKYRFRFLGVGPSRFWQFHLSDDSPMIQIAEDGNLLPNPVVRDSGIRMGVAERCDVIVDFSRYKLGDVVYLQNRLEQIDGRGPTGNLLLPGDLLLKFIVDHDAKDPSQVPAKLCDLPSINPNEVVQTRTWRFERQNGGWAINGQFFDVNTIRAHVKQNTAEFWVLQNSGGSWSHPLHIHFEEFRLLSRNGLVPPLWEQGRKDVVKLNPNEQVVFFMRFRDWTGRYPFHCHNTVHEDHAMMIRWELEA